ncbi:MAG: glycosyltransferase [Bacteroidia bacterium]
MINCSIVTYRHSINQLRLLLTQLQTDPLIKTIFIIDNWISNNLQKDLAPFTKVNYIFNHANLGYGKAHNIALKKSINEVDYHIVINPDIELQEQTISDLYAYMQNHQNIGLIMPKVLYPDGSIQYLCKMLPTPFDLIGRRFLPAFMQKTMQKRLQAYELKHKNYNLQMEIPNLSGCFMFLRCSALQTTGLFDEHFFMYLEDTDLSRRINQQYQTVYYPNTAVIHHYEKGSYKNFKLLTYHIKSAFYYFGKWGWLFDPMRTTINKLLKA